MSLARRIVAEFLGTALLLAVVVGSGIMAERLSAGNVALALLANSLATGAGLSVLILCFAPISGAHFNPVVTLVMAGLQRLEWRAVPAYLAAQTLGALAGVAAAHLMFDLRIFSLSQHARSGGGLWFSEIVASFGLLTVILSGLCYWPERIALAVGAYITAAYWFTASTSFANPAVTLARAFTDTFTGIRLQDVPAFVAAQLLGACAAAFLLKWLHGTPRSAGGGSRLDGSG